MIHMIDFYVDVLVIAVCIISIIAKVSLARFQLKMRDETREMRREMAEMRQSADEARQSADLMVTFSLMKQLGYADVRFLRDRALRAEAERDRALAALKEMERKEGRQ